MPIVVLTQNLTGAAKFQTSSMLSMKYDQVLQKPQPKREDYATEKEYEEAKIKFMLETLEFVSAGKKEAFVLNLDRYNQFLGNIRNMEDIKKKAEQNHIQEAERLEKEQRKSFLSSAIASLIFPAGFPLFLAFIVARSGYNRIMIDQIKSQSIREEAFYQSAKEIQYDFYDFVCSLRSDYHETNRELKELKERAKKGENIMPRLLEIISPERVGLQKIDTQFLWNPEEEKQQDLPKISEAPQKVKSNE